jgi:hypothetical protein
MKYLLPLIAVFALTASAADISGTWKGTADTPNGPVERTFVFKADGNKLTGETSSPMFGKSAIADGTINGDNIAFDITVKFEDNEMKVHYTGKVSGDEIKMHVESAGGEFALDYTVKKVST